jgi:hypothetical protein
VRTNESKQINWAATNDAANALRTGGWEILGVRDSITSGSTAQERTARADPPKQLSYQCVSDENAHGASDGRSSWMSI